MPFQQRMIRVNRSLVNPVLGRFAGRSAPLAMIEHRGRRTGRSFTTPVFAFEHDGMVTVALTYGSEVQWLANVRAAGGCRLTHRGRRLQLGAPTMIDAETGLGRMPAIIRRVLVLASVKDFVEVPVLSGVTPSHGDAQPR
jgi:deazaflavin-dependent oxidoreductase (nitroreductase family)